jgi:hypothetical protein
MQSTHSFLKQALLQNREIVAHDKAWEIDDLILKAATNYNVSVADRIIFLKSFQAKLEKAGADESHHVIADWCVWILKSTLTSAPTLIG